MPVDPRKPSYEARRLGELLTALAIKARLGRHDKWPRERIDAVQRHRLAKTINHASQQSRYYREAYSSFIDPAKTPLHELPVVGKAQLMERYDDWVTDPRLRLVQVQQHLETFNGPDGYYGRRYRVLTSAGSSGRRGVFAFASREWATYIAGLLRFTDWIGTAPRIGRRMREATVAAGHPSHATARGAASVDVGLARVLHLDATTPVPELVAALAAFQPDWLHAYPSIAALLADEQTDGRLQIRPRVVSTSSELRTPEMVGRIESAWGHAPYDMYGMTEAGIFAIECERHRLHVLDDEFVFEIVDADNQPVEPGATGDKILFTNLWMRTQPLIRYEIDDRIALSPSRCPCGRPFPVIDTVDGRSDEVLRLPDDRGGVVPIHPMHFRDPMSAERGVRQYEVIHRSTEIVLRLVPDHGADRPALAERVREAVARQLASAGAASPPLRVEFVDVLDRDRDRMSKLKLIRSETSD